MATKLALVVYINVFLIFLYFSTSCLGAPPKKSSFARRKNQIEAALEIAKLINNLLDKQHQTDESPTEEVPQSSGIYKVSFAIGTPPQNVTSIMDISDGFSWTQCKTCDVCLIQNTPLYNPELSSTYSNFSTLRCDSADSSDRSFCDYFGITTSETCPDLCEYIIWYDDEKNSTGLFATDSFTLSSISAPNIFFGCGLENYGYFDNLSGMLGLGRGPLSIISQFALDRFSYCLASDQRKDSPVNFGSSAKLEGSGQSTPLLGTDQYPDLYYIGLVGITVGESRLNIPSSTFKLDENGDGGVFLATIYVFTYLEQAAYDLVVQAFSSSMKDQTAVDGTDLGLDLCYKKGTKWPALKLHFDGGATLELNTVNYVYKVSSTDIQCLAILPSSGISALGSFIQMDTKFVIDLNNKTISFQSCNASSSVAHLATIMALFLFCVLKFF